MQFSLVKCYRFSTLLQGRFIIKFILHNATKLLHLLFNFLTIYHWVKNKQLQAPFHCNYCVAGYDKTSQGEGRIVMTYVPSHLYHILFELLKACIYKCRNWVRKAHWKWWSEDVKWLEGPIVLLVHCIGRRNLLTADHEAKAHKIKASTAGGYDHKVWYWHFYGHVSLCVLLCHRTLWELLSSFTVNPRNCRRLKYWYVKAMKTL